MMATQDEPEWDGMSCPDCGTPLDPAQLLYCPDCAAKRLAADKPGDSRDDRYVRTEEPPNVDTARSLVNDALFMCQYGERPPGAPRDDWSAETWGDWCRRAETFLRGES